MARAKRTKHRRASAGHAERAPRRRRHRRHRRLRKLHARRVAGRSAGRKPRHPDRFDHFGSGFVKQAGVLKKGLGLPLCRWVSIPARRWSTAKKCCVRRCRKSSLPAICERLTSAGVATGSIVEAEPAPGEIVFTGTFDEIQEHFHRQAVERRPADRSADARARRGFPRIHRSRPRRSAARRAAGRPRSVRS